MMAAVMVGAGALETKIATGGETIVLPFVSDATAMILNQPAVLLVHVFVQFTADAPLVNARLLLVNVFDEEIQTATFVMELPLPVAPAVPHIANPEPILVTTCRLVGDVMLTCGGASIFSVTEAESILLEAFVTV